MKDKYQDIVELVEFNRKTISAMFFKKPVNLPLAQDCLIEIKSLVQELYENNQFVALAKALEKFSITTSLDTWPDKKPFTDEHRELIKLIIPTFGISVLDVGYVLTDDKEFNRECIEKSHPRLATFFEKGLPVAAAMKKLIANHEFESLELLIEKTKDSFMSAHSTGPVILFALVDEVIRYPNDNAIEEYFLKHIVPRLPPNRIPTYPGMNDHNGLDYVTKLIDLGKFELSNLAFNRLKLYYHQAIIFFRHSEALNINNIDKAIASELVNNAIRHGDLSDNDKKILLCSAIRQSNIKIFDSYMKTDWVPWSLKPAIINAVCAEFESCKNAKHRKKFQHGITTLIMRELQLAQNSGKPSVKSLINTMRQHTHLAKQMELIPELQRQRLESDLAL